MAHNTTRIYHHGINLGGWLAQYDFTGSHPLTPQQRDEHFLSFIREEDIQRIHDWGFDHVRVPIDGRSLLAADATLPAQVIAALDRCLDWCASRGMAVIFDLHDFEGNEYGQMQRPIPLLTDSRIQWRFLRFWRWFATRFRDYPGEMLMFELFNEISDATAYSWRLLYKQAVRVIRSVDNDRMILIGSNHQNSVNYLNQLDLLDDSHVMYTFHYYDPQVFTHQKAHFSEELRDFGQTITYPGDISAFGEYLRAHPQWLSKHSLTADETRNDRALMERLLADAADFVEYSGQRLYCGEYGVIDTAPPEETVKWLADFWQISDSMGFGRALWNYKALDFGLVDASGTIVHPQLVQALSTNS